MTEINPLFARDQRDQITLDLFRRLARRQSHPTRESLYVCIDHDSRGDAKRRSQNDVSRFSADARQLGQFVEIARDLPTMPLDDLVGHCQQASSLRAEETGRTNEGFQFVGVGQRPSLQGRESGGTVRA